MLDTSRPRRRNLISLTPLIDVVFILLVFFMLASSFLEWRAVQLEAPAEAGGAGSMEGAMLVEIRSDGLRLAGEMLSEGDLHDRISARVREEADTRVLVMPAPGVSMQDTVNVLEGLADVGARNLSVIRQAQP
ncbi:MULTISPECIES: biopolymer transporter ExbD [unclassified Thioalkalivibrio]|jgi:biopolymer transport protein ExbD|uniref:ExbD/TolR family protein n=1 Tax=unclassified Thioalkalivibrio TaxID=2621013 RepID=UPI000195A9FF|nr:MULTISPECIES: biopolymer transporter ExbD [unclassified Thioalkalivibrio]ADC70954.1 Biopolymer transport protein ExbD/TolR [Thioalkalivibrio sp. K90mix]